MEQNGRLLATGIGFTEMAKPPVEGYFHIYTLKDSTGRYVAKVVGTNNDNVVVVDDGNSVDGLSFALVKLVLDEKYS